MSDQIPESEASPQQQNNSQQPESSTLLVSAPVDTDQPIKTAAAHPDLNKTSELVQDFTPNTQEPEPSFVNEIEGFESKRIPLEPVSWTASEYIAHQKNLGWYLVLGIVVIIMTVLIYFLTSGDIFSSVCVLILAVLFGVYAGRQPREQEYLIDELGVHIGHRTYGFDVLKSFSIIDEGPFSSIVFMPLKRFMPLISIYYDPADEDKIATFLSEYLPLEYRKHDIIEKLMHKIKF